MLYKYTGIAPKEQQDHLYWCVACEQSTAVTEHGRLIYCFTCGWDAEDFHTAELQGFGGHDDSRVDCNIAVFQRRSNRIIVLPKHVAVK